MNYNPYIAVSDLKGVALKNADGTDALYGDFIVNSLLSGFNEKTTGEEKAKAFKLALRIHSCIDPSRGSGLLELTNDEVTQIKKAAAPGSTVMAYGRLEQFLDNPE